jgi:hypothetical protein
LRRARDAAAEEGREPLGRRVEDIVAAARDALAFGIRILVTIGWIVRIGPVERFRPLGEIAGEIVHVLGRRPGRALADGLRLPPAAAKDGAWAVGGSSPQG